MNLIDVYEEHVCVDFCASFLSGSQSNLIIRIQQQIVTNFLSLKFGVHDDDFVEEDFQVPRKKKIHSLFVSAAYSPLKKRTRPGRDSH